MKRIGTSDLEISPLCLGGNPFGWTASAEESFAVLDRFVEAGGNIVDTADVYSVWKPGNRGGESETIIGEWMKKRGNRSRIMIATKVGFLPARPGLSTANIRAAVEESLQRLQSDYIDLYYAHTDDLKTPLEETLGTFNELVLAGKVRYIAASNYSQERLAEALRVSKGHGWASYVALQPHFNLLEQGNFPEGYRSFCARERIGVLPYYSLASGFLTGKYCPGTQVKSARAAGVQKYATDRGWAAVAKLQEIAVNHKTTMAAVALAWLRQQESIVAPIASARVVSQLEDSLPTPMLSGQELADLTKAGA
jgi:aryl-alcohol dehydrogenase-like predicted oxidoreductase